MISNAQERAVIDLREGWRFFKGENDQAFQKDFDDSDWQRVTVPHDWAIYGPFDKEHDKQTVAIVKNGEEIETEKTGRTGALPYMGQGWYRTNFNLAQYKQGQKVLLVFEGAMSEPRIYINGQKAGEWNYGYS